MLGIYSYRFNKSILLVYLLLDLVEIGFWVEVELLGNKCFVVVVKELFFDIELVRMRRELKVVKKEKIVIKN